jgi:hypothetical protein
VGPCGNLFRTCWGLANICWIFVKHLLGICRAFAGFWGKSWERVGKELGVGKSWERVGKELQKHNICLCFWCFLGLGKSWERVGKESDLGKSWSTNAPQMFRKCSTNIPQMSNKCQQHYYKDPEISENICKGPRAPNKCFASGEASSALELELEQAPTKFDIWLNSGISSQPQPQDHGGISSQPQPQPAPAPASSHQIPGQSRNTITRPFQERHYQANPGTPLPGQSRNTITRQIQ